LRTPIERPKRDKSQMASKERTMAEENKSGDVSDENGNEGDENYLGSWKTKEAAEVGLQNMQTMLDNQGNEVGALRKQNEFTQKVIEDLQVERAAAPQENTGLPNYDQEMAAIQKDMAKLDPVDDNYQSDMAALSNSLIALAGKAQHEKTLSAATAAFKQELDERDVKATHASFYRDNPDFNTPEMQAKIQEYLAKDTTGMSDSLVAYREIQRDMAAIKAKQLKEENAELKRLADLAKGASETGKVITKGQSPQQQKTNQPKTTGAERDAGMQAVLDNLRG